LDKDELDDIRKDDASEYIGIGTSVDFSAADMAVTVGTADSPADLAGVDPGDTIASIDSATIVGMRLRDIARRMRDARQRTGDRISARRQRCRPHNRGAAGRFSGQTVLRVRSLENGMAWIHVTAFEGRPGQDLVVALETTDMAPSNYRIRKAHAPHQLSSLEAAVQALGLKGAPGRFSPLLEAGRGRRYLERVSQTLITAKGKGNNARASYISEKIKSV